METKTPITINVTIITLLLIFFLSMKLTSANAVTIEFEHSLYLTSTLTGHFEKWDYAHSSLSKLRPKPPVSSKFMFILSSCAFFPLGLTFDFLFGQSSTGPGFPVP